ncbi:adenine phosphoribosyltransferase [Erythrobacteraceae bacterium CFH 75059]|nr:adenine phosphoribosyltransferase [Erythrobacteraceae bacterium CFH 75059]
MSDDADRLLALIPVVPDFPRPGIAFRDLGPLLANADALRWCSTILAGRVRESGATHVAGIEARGFIIGAAVARDAGCGFVALRKPGKLPGRPLSRAYALEYGADRLELDPGLLPPSARVAVIDDVLATGGTARVAVGLIEEAGAHAVMAGFVVAIAALGGADTLRVPVRRLLDV